MSARVDWLDYAWADEESTRSGPVTIFVIVDGHVRACFVDDERAAIEYARTLEGVVYVDRHHDHVSRCVWMNEECEHHNDEIARQNTVPR